MLTKKRLILFGTRHHTVKKDSARSAPGTGIRGGQVPPGAGSRGVVDYPNGAFRS